MGNKNRRQVVASQEEANMARKAESLRQQGETNFESVYGRKDAGSYNVGADQAELYDIAQKAGKPVPNSPNTGEYFSGVNQMSVEPKTKRVSNPKPEAAQKPQEVPQGPPPAPATPDTSQDTETEEGAKALSEDPVKRAEQISNDLIRIAKLSDTLPAFKAPPLPDTLLQWKQDHGDIFLLSIGAHSYIYRYIKRQEWLQLLASPGFDQAPDEQNNEKLFDKCCLWPKPDAVQKAALPANSMGMVVQQIRIQSMFLDPAYVANMTIKI